MQTLFSSARWVWTADPGSPSFAVRRFRGTLTLDAAQTIAVHVSADCRYTLFLDGCRLGRGPARSDLRHYVYETYEVPLPAGVHVLAAIVAAYHGAVGPIAEMHDRGAFLLEAHAADGSVVCATGGDGWRVQADQAYQSVPMTMTDGFYGIGASERVDGARVPHGWEQAGFSDAHWEQPAIVSEACLRERPGDFADPGGRWRLVPRDIPPMRETRRAFDPWPGPVVVPANSRREWLLNAGEYAAGYPVLAVAGGAGAELKIVYAEARTTSGAKHVRDEGAEILGFGDTYFPGGGSETYSPLHWRAFRFVRLTVQTADEPLTLTDFSYLLTGYPWERQAALTVDNGPDTLQTVLDTDFRTLERCTAETFMDCPYYEQLQYVGDSRLQALLSYVATGDTRLGARAVRLFDWSRSSDGLTQSRYPSRVEQVIPPFSLLWVLMVEDLWRHAPGERGTARACLPGCRSVLDWFGRHVTSDGVAGGRLPWWNFVDWIPHWNTPSGTPPPVADGEPSATINLQYLAALQAHTRLSEAAGETREAERSQAQADALCTAIRTVFWDDKAALMREGPGTGWENTQHAQAWGILTGAVPNAAVQQVCDRLHDDKTLTQASFYHLFYVVEALAKARRLEHLWERWLMPWREALALHFSTWPETPEPTRSDCHAWSAWPTYALLTHILGVKPSGDTYEVTPSRVKGWDKVAGKAAIPAGLLHVSVEWPASGPPHVAHRLEQKSD